MSRGFDLFIEEALRYRRYYEDPVGLGRMVKEIAQRRIPGAAVYIFGSVARGTYTAGSDIDVLIILPHSYSREVLDRLKAEIMLEIDAPIEVHIATREEFERWYARFIRGEELVEV